MEWQIKFSLEMNRWCVYRVDAAQRFLEQTFTDKDCAKSWAATQQKHFDTPVSKNPDCVEEASFESFPASDAPGWVNSQLVDDSLR